MDIIQSVTQRRSVRAFTSKAVPQAVLTEIMTMALRSPPWANTQPWEFAIVTGEQLAEIRKRFVEKEGDTPAPDIPHISYFPEPYESRCRIAVAKSHASKSIQRENKEQRRWWKIQQLNNFEANCEIYICIDHSFCNQNGNLNVWPIYDCGTVAGFITLLAPRYGLGTIIQARAVIYPNIVREVLGMANSKLILVGIGIGYPDSVDPVNQYTTDREPLDKLVGWYGFES